MVGINMCKYGYRKWWTNEGVTVRFFYCDGDSGVCGAAQRLPPEAVEGFPQRGLSTKARQSRVTYRAGRRWSCALPPPQHAEAVKRSYDSCNKAQQPRRLSR